jgi:hypothetical protein
LSFGVQIDCCHRQCPLSDDSYMAPTETPKGRHDRRRPLDLLRSWHQKAEAWMLEQAGVEAPSASEEPGALRVVASRG